MTASLLKVRNATDLQLIGRDLKAIEQFVNGMVVDPLNAMPNVKRDGHAVGDGIVDDTAAIQATINLWTDKGGGPVFVPPGKYKISSTINCLRGTRILGSGMSSPRTSAEEVCILDAGANTTTTALKWPGNSANGALSDIWLKGPIAALVTSGEYGGFYGGSTGLDPGFFGSRFRSDNVYITGFANQLACQFLGESVFVNMFCDLARTHGLSLRGSADLDFYSCLFANAAGLSSASNAANIYSGSDSLSSNINFYGAITDEAFGNSSSIYIKGGDDFSFNNMRVFLTHGGYGVRVGSAANRLTLNNVRVAPFAVDRVPVNTIKLEGGADHRLINVTTDANGGGDISDAGSSTQWMNVNGRYKFPTLPTSTPGAGELWRNSNVLTQS